MVPQDVSGLATLMGGRGAAATRLDGFFHDANGNWAVLGGSALRYDPTNEPDIHAPWLYNGLGQPWKTQATVRQIVDTAYGLGPSGLPGNDDLGTMSAWYVFAAIGMFPQTPGRAEMLLGSPIFTRVIVDRANGVHLTIDADSTDAYVQSVKLNNSTLRRSWLPESFLQRGGTVTFTQTTTPNTTWGTAPADLPKDH
jgi:putative alpha-1,2-mannosidase